jgi:hypothetical protein
MYDSKECKRAGDGKDVVKGEYLLRTELEPGLRLTAEIEKISGLKIFGMERLEQKKATYVGRMLGGGDTENEMDFRSIDASCFQLFYNNMTQRVRTPAFYFSMINDRYIHT